MQATRRDVLVLAAGGAAGIAAPAKSQAAYPNRPIRLIVPYAAGGGTDFFARLAGASMSQSLGQQVVVENRPGAGTNIGAEAVARAEPDGYTLLLGDTSTFASNKSVYKKLPYDPATDFSPISLTGRFAIVLLVNTDKLKAGSVRELVEIAKRSPEGISYGSAGIGSPFHLAAELLAQAAGIKLTHIPYRGMAPAVQDLAAGQIGMIFADFATARTQLAGGPVKAIAVASPGEFYGLPGVPPIARDFRGFEAWAWQGVVAPARTPADVISKLQLAYARAATDAEFRRKLTEAGIDVLQSTPAEMASYMRDEADKWEKVIRNANISIE